MEDTFVYATKKPEEVIAGLAEIQAAIDEWIKYHQDRTAFERGDIDYEEIPSYDPGKIDALLRQYPTAAAYLEADRWTRSDEPIKIRLGIKGCDRILAGEDYNTVLNDMTTELAAFYLAQEV